MILLKLVDYTLVLTKNRRKLLESDLIVRSNSLSIIQAPNGSGKSLFLKNIINISDACYNTGDKIIFGLKKENLSSDSFSKDILYIPQETSFISLNHKPLVYFRKLCLLKMSYVQTNDFIKIIKIFFKDDSRLNLFLNSRIKNLSGGDRKILHICSLLTLSSSARLILIDEPLNNVEIDRIKSLCNFISRLKTEKKAVIVVSHLSVFPRTDAIYTILKQRLVSKKINKIDCFGELNKKGYFKE
jgi:ABC-type Mn2+/Zn2+ transport system ATPase subunit